MLFIAACGTIFLCQAKEVMFMAKFIPKGKLSKKAQKEINRQRRVTWGFSPVTKTVESRKIYSRKKKAQNRDDYGLSFSYTCRRKEFQREMFYLPACI